jgi:DNA-binding XRE family transcriptional regulator
MTDDMRALRREHALTLNEAAAGILHPVSLCKIESGQTEPRPRTIRKLADRYRTTTADITQRWLVVRARWLAEQTRAVTGGPAPLIPPPDVPADAPPAPRRNYRRLPRLPLVKLPPVLAPSPTPAPLPPDLMPLARESAPAPPTASPRPERTLRGSDPTPFPPVKVPA